MQHADAAARLNVPGRRMQECPAAQATLTRTSSRHATDKAKGGGILHGEQPRNKTTGMMMMMSSWIRTYILRMWVWATEHGERICLQILYKLLPLLDRKTKTFDVSTSKCIWTMKRLYILRLQYISVALRLRSIRFYSVSWLRSIR